MWDCKRCGTYIRRSCSCFRSGVIPWTNQTEDCSFQGKRRNFHTDSGDTIPIIRTWDRCGQKTSQNTEIGIVSPECLELPSPSTVPVPLVACHKRELSLLKASQGFCTPGRGFPERTSLSRDCGFAPTCSPQELRTTAPPRGPGRPDPAQEMKRRYGARDGSCGSRQAA